MTRGEGDSEHMVKFGTLQPNGELTNVRHIRQSDIGACPHVIFDPSHYRPDGSCIECHNADMRARCPKRLALKAVMAEKGVK